VANGGFRFSRARGTRYAGAEHFRIRSTPGFDQRQKTAAKEPLQ
jgi:hypothetical protein